MRVNPVYIVSALLIMSLSGAKSKAEELIKGFEGLRLKAYKDTNGYYAIGYGNTWHYDKNRWVQAGDVITQEQALRWMRTHIKEKRALIDLLVKPSLTANEMDALISLVYNIGATAFEKSNMLKELNAGASKQEVANDFDKWIYADGVVNSTLKNRRAKEKAVFLS